MKPCRVGRSDGDMERQKSITPRDNQMKDVKDPNKRGHLSAQLEYGDHMPPQHPNDFGSIVVPGIGFKGRLSLITVAYRGLYEDSHIEQSK